MIGAASAASLRASQCKAYLPGRVRRGPWRVGGVGSWGLRRADGAPGAGFKGEGVASKAPCRCPQQRSTSDQAGGGGGGCTRSAARNEQMVRPRARGGVRKLGGGGELPRAALAAPDSGWPGRPGLCGAACMGCVWRSGPRGALPRLYVEWARPARFGRGSSVSRRREVPMERHTLPVWHRLSGVTRPAGACTRIAAVTSTNSDLGYLDRAQRCRSPWAARAGSKPGAMATFKRPSAGCSPCLTIACILIGCLVTLPNPAAAAGRGAAAPGRRLSQSTPAPPPSPDASLAAPSDCSKWLNERRMYVEGQAWFTRCAAAQEVGRGRGR